MLPNFFTIDNAQMWKVRCWNCWAHWSPSSWLKSKLVHLRGWMHVLHMVLGFLDFTCANYTLQIHVEEAVHSAWVNLLHLHKYKRCSYWVLCSVACLVDLPTGSSSSTPFWEQYTSMAVDVVYDYAYEFEIIVKKLGRLVEL
jgi:hypothetical protein